MVKEQTALTQLKTRKENSNMSKRAVGVLNGNWSGGDRNRKDEYVHNDAREQIEKGQTQYFLEKESEWMGKCAEVEGVDSFMAWYNDGANVPNEKVQASVRIELVKAHYEALKLTHAAAFYWLTVEKQEAENCIQIEGRDGFAEWWNSDAFPQHTTPKERVELIRARIEAFLASDGTTQVQARVRELQQAIIAKKATNISEVVNEMAELGNHLQRAGVEIGGDEGEIR
jgi:hypothetical protein